MNEHNIARYTFQIEIINTKISMREAECKERMNLVRSEVQQFREIRSQVRAKVHVLIDSRENNVGDYMNCDDQGWY